MSFLTQVLSSAAAANVEIVKQNLPLIIQKLLLFNEEIVDYIEDCYRKFIEWPEWKPNFRSTTTKLTTDIKDLQEKVEHITTNAVPNKLSEMDAVSTELNEAFVKLNTVTLLVDIHELFVGLRKLLEVEDYVAAAFEISKLETYFANIAKEEFTDVFTLLKSKLIMEKSQVWCELDKIYEKNFILIDKDVGNATVNVIKIRKGYNFLELLKALKYLSEDSLEQLDSFKKFLLVSFCEPIINNLTKLKVEDEENFAVLSVFIKKASNQDHYKTVYDKLIEVFRFLCINFSYKFDNFETTTYIGKGIEQEFSEMLIKNCLCLITSEDLLKSSEDEKNFQEIMDHSLSFQKELIECGIFTENSNQITDYVNNLETMLINKKCNEHLSNSIKIMKKDLHNFVEIPQIKGIKDFKDFPSCCVSRSAIELLSLTTQLLEKSLDESDLLKHNLLSVIQTIFNQYGNIVYEHHKKLLESIPQQVALYRNNCMYIAFSLVKLDATYVGKFPHLNTSIFMYHVHQLKDMGNTIFTKYVEQQIKQMETTLDEYEFNTQTLSDRLNPDTDKCIRQCMRQYELLKTVWRKILPLAVYNETLSYLLSTFCKRLIDVVVGTEDLPSKNSEQLVDMFKIIITRGPKLFDDPNEISLLVKNWQKLSDLIFVLAGSLSDINDRWANGKGPLTLHFEAKEMRKLIKALFQNSERRDAVLSRICD